MKILFYIVTVIALGLGLAGVRCSIIGVVNKDSKMLAEGRFVMPIFGAVLFADAFLGMVCGFFTQTQSLLLSLIGLLPVIKFAINYAKDMKDLFK